ncbi:hypothetical protein [Lacinutrix jangbogonensis]|uniref:hypothetical protein n=1 Tax=Lacinutrix jangbogonensis TaxID=1469557 RepID=UPI00053ECCE7|nr:hypothetical protein [Lacinutrix jangbogonensis]
MKKTHLIICLIALSFTSCSSVKVLNSWKAENVSSVKDNNMLVIARTDNTSARIAFENEIVKQLQEKGIKATASFTKFPKLNPDQKIDEEKQKMIKAMLKKEGFNGVVLTVIKDTQELSKTVSDGGGYVGGNYYGYYPRYYGGFYGYYRNPMSYSTYGNYVPETSTTYTATNYILETVVYNLEEEGEKQLVTVLTSRIEEPENASAIAKEYVKAIAKSFNKK